MEFSPTGDYLAIGDWQRIQLWNVRTKQFVRSFDGFSGYVVALAFSPRGDLLAATILDDHDRAAGVKVFDVQSGKIQYTLHGHSDVVWNLAFSPNGNTLTTASWDGTTRFWDMRNGKEYLKLNPNAGRNYCVDFSPDGELVATGYQNGAVYIWNARSGRQFETLSAPGGPWQTQGAIGNVCFSLDNRSITSINEYGTECAWDIRTRALRRTIIKGQGVLRNGISAGRRLYITGYSHDWIAGDRHYEVVIRNFGISQKVCTPVSGLDPAAPYALSADGRTAAIFTTKRQHMSGVELWDIR